MLNISLPPTFKPNESEPPIRDEIFSEKRFEQYAVYLASELNITHHKKKNRSLLPRVKENEQLLKASYHKLTTFASEGIALSPAGEWIIDNYHIIQDQIREIKEDLPVKYYEGLPKISKGELSNYPRVYAIALTLVAHLDSRININTVKKFVSSYQSITPLQIGELWAIPIALRIALLENLRRLAKQTVIDQEAKIKVDLIVNDFIESRLSTDHKHINSLSQMLGRSQAYDCVTISQLSQILHTEIPEILPICEKIDEYLTKNNLDMDKIVKQEHQIQTLNQMSVSNAITSMRLLSNTNWQEFFESLCLIEPILNQDPSGTYKKMEFTSRDQYRNSIERIQKKTGSDEIEIAKEIVQLAKETSEKFPDDLCRHHIGYYLIGKGVKHLEKRLNYTPPLKTKLKRAILDHPTHFYFCFLLFFVVILLTPLIIYINNFTSYEFWKYIIFAIALIPASDSAINILNLFITYFVGPKILPKIDLSKGIPHYAKTFVIVPTIINNQKEIPKLIEDLEIRFLANQSKNLYFALLSDFSDAKTKNTRRDKCIIKELQESILKLNQKYNSTRNQFYLFHRERIWNSKEEKWMGWERKRGKIHEFNQFLRGNLTTSFVVAPKQSHFFSNIKYVITLDSDTKLPRNSAKKLIGTILHPLNAPQLDKKDQIVKKGYSILQPRISISPESSVRTMFTKLYSGHTGIDPYTTAISDTYQDLFGEGIYTGKGLYVVDTFEASLKDRVPENKLLSHDLFEGIHARTALVSDIEFLDDYPSHYESFARRQHRWIRGDWQIIQWLFSKVPDSKGGLRPTSLSLISRWKIFDNLRRSLVAPTTLVWFLLGWTILPGHASLWTAIILLMLTLSFYVHTASQLFKFSKNLSLITHMKSLIEDLKTYFAQLALTIITLPHQSYLHLHAIKTSLYRVYFSKTNLLEWTTAAQVESERKNTAFFMLNVFRFTTLISAFTLIVVSFIRPSSLYTSIIFIIAWMLSTFLLKWISAPQKNISTPINHNDQLMLRSIAVRTWSFFETFVTKKDHWLPPDNFQEDPVELIAHRTSPTNIGLYLLSCCSAYNFGYICSKQLIERIENTLKTIEKLPKYYGHLYNWYNTISLKPLEPDYISTVDSGNLAGHLLAVKQTCLDLKDKVFSHEKAYLALEDILIVLKEETSNLNFTILRITDSQRSQINLILDKMFNQVKTLSQANPKERKQIFIKLDFILNSLRQLIDEFTKEYNASTFENIAPWIKRFGLRLKHLNEEQNLFKNKSDLLFSKRYEKAANTCQQIVQEMNFSILYDKKRKLFSIGYNTRDGKSDESYYDLLASEARLTSFISISKGDIPQDHWFHLGRQMTSLYHKRVLISWSASMFEYLMPLLVMKDYVGTLLHETYQSVLKQQIAYGHDKDLPWGLSESAYNARDINTNYQYGPFGVPGIGLKRGLSQDYVLSPYSTILAGLVEPKSAIINLKRLIKNNFLTTYGFYDAIDYTESRIPPKESFAIVKNFMAHHQGMSLVALDNMLHKDITRNRFHNDPLVKSSELLLQERIPKKVSTMQTRPEEMIHKKIRSIEQLTSLYQIKNVLTKIPEVRVLSNGSYSVMLTASGSGFSKCNDFSVYRWQEDPTLEKHGQYYFITNDSNNPITSLTYTPIAKNPKHYKTTFSDHKVEFWCESQSIATHSEVIVSAEDNVELRRITFTNLTDLEKTFELTSYVEPVLSTPDSDLSHPAFNKLFLETDYIPERYALIAKRRKRTESDQDHHAIHKIVFDKKNCSNLQYETDKAIFFGRKNNWNNAYGLTKDSKFTNSHNNSLDTIFSFKIKVHLKPHETTKVLFIGAMAESRNEALRYIDRYNDISIFDREDKMSWTQSQIELRHLNINIDEVTTFQKVAGALIFSCPNLRPTAEVIARNTKSQSSLWNFGISGDVPILLISIKSDHHIHVLQDALQLHEYLRGRNIQFDLVILYDESISYRMALYDKIMYLLRTSRSTNLINKKGGVFVLRKDMATQEDLNLLKSVARVYIDAYLGSLKKQVKLLLKASFQSSQKNETLSFPKKWKKSPIKRPNLNFFNGYGGFKNNGKEYQIYLKEKLNTPAPWINVISNSKGFGFLISESGTSHTWSQNSRENRITPWSNDPIHDPSGEIIYLVDQKTNQKWSVTPAPIRNDSPYLIRHGQGYSIFEHNSHELAQTLTLYVSLDDEIKLVRLKIKNQSSFKRKISAISYWEWVLGFHRSKTAHNIIPKKEENIFLFSNPLLLDFESRITYVSCNKDISSYTTNRASFLGRFGDYANPIGLNVEKLNGEVSAGIDPCLALKIDLELMPNQEEEIIFVLGQTDKTKLNKELIKTYLSSVKADQTLRNVLNFWNQTLQAVQIKTAYPEFDILINRWMLYQTLSCRIWARTAFYQSGGAFGFRDQLQDVTSLIHTDPKLVRKYILKAASHQFKEGDVLHWWHPPSDKGVRTRFSDDLLWLPFVTSYYLNCTKDISILDEVIPFVEGPALKEDQDDLYIMATRGENQASLYQHCVLALNKSLKLGSHGLPLMGSGDWNDGMSRVANKGKGESVWLAWFLGMNLDSFISICQQQGDHKKAQNYRDHLEKLKISLETTGWDGQWYRRAYFDDASPLGSRENDECKISSIAQSWSVISNLGSKEHRLQALKSADKYLIDKKNKIVHLFAPPFEHIVRDPGYIKGYPPGVRENGGQYTHAAIWLAIAYAKENDANKAFDILDYINPIKKSFTKKNAQKYTTEPYVITADVYSQLNLKGKGGWSWYTGSAGWYYRAFTESILGLKLCGNKLLISPSFPKDLDSYEIQYRFGQSNYNILVKKNNKTQLYIDGEFIGKSIEIPLIDDRKDHVIKAFINLPS